MATQPNLRTLADLWRELPAQITRNPSRVDAICGLNPAGVVAPVDEAQFVTVMRWANENGLGVALRGGGTKMGWGNTPVGLDVVISTENLCRVVEHAWEDMTATVQAGTTISDFQRTLAKNGQRLAIDPLWPERASVGGVISTNDSGPLRLRFGSIRDLIIGATVVLAHGTIAKSGGKVVKNVAGYDLPKLMTGAFGTLAVITEATFRLHPLPRLSRTMTFTFADVASANRFMLRIADSELVPTGVQLRVGTDAQPSVDVRLEGIEAGIEAQAARLREFAGTDAMGDSDEVWRASQQMWGSQTMSTICKFSVLPSEVSAAISSMRTNVPGEANVVAQSIGLGVVRFDVSKPEPLIEAIARVRYELQRRHGSLVVLYCPDEIRKKIDVWGNVDAQPLMVRIKQQFDPKGTLNPGRFVGGI